MINPTFLATMTDAQKSAAIADVVEDLYEEYEARLGLAAAMHAIRHDGLAAKIIAEARARVGLPLT